MEAVASTITAPPGGQISTDVSSADLITVVVGHAVSAVLERFRPQLRAIVLTGSMARGEGTFIKRPDGWETLGDCEMVLIFESHQPLPAMRQVTDVQAEIERQLKRRGIACSVGMSPVHPSYLVNLQPHIYAYELRNCGRLLWGDPNVLALIPAFSPGEIPLEDAWRMVCNRMIEQLVGAAEGSQTALVLRTQADYKTIKLCLDLATSFLLFCGEYAPTYEARSARLKLLSEKASSVDGLPFPLPPFAALVQTVTRWKLLPTSETLDAESLLQPMVWDYARRLWRWEILQLTGDAGGPSNSYLMRRWMRFQPIHRRLRGWVSLARKQSLFSSWRQLPHWLSLAMMGSPRHCIYAAGSELFFQLPFLMGAGGNTCPDGFLRAWREWLPVRPKQEPGRRIPWQQLASEITWNYRQFLMETCS